MEIELYYYVIDVNISLQIKSEKQNAKKLKAEVLALTLNYTKYQKSVCFGISKDVAVAFH